MSPVGTNQASNANLDNQLNVQHCNLASPPHFDFDFHQIMKNALTQLIGFGAPSRLNQPLVLEGRDEGDLSEVNNSRHQGSLAADLVGSLSQT